MAGGSDDPWGVREEPAEFQGVGNMGIRDQQQHIIRGSICLLPNSVITCGGCSVKTITIRFSNA